MWCSEVHTNTMNRRKFFTLSALMLLVLLVFAMQPAAAQGSLTWGVQFYNNVLLQGTPVATRQDTSIAFNWGTGAPHPGVNVDNWSARWSTSTRVAAGTYRFWILADDGVHLWINNHNLVINTYDQPRPGQLLTADVTLPADTVNIQIDFREVTGDAYLYFDWANLASNPSGPRFSTTPPTSTGGTTTPSGAWTGQYYNNRDLSGTPVLVRSDASPSVNWGTGSPAAGVVNADNFSVRWTTSVYLAAGTYRFNVQADDGVRLYVNGVRYIDAWGPAQNRVFTVDVPLIALTHTIVVEYQEQEGLAFLNFSYGLVPGTGSSPPPASSGATAVVTTGMLNVRNAPDPINGLILTRVRQGQTLTVLGRNADSSWWQIQTGSTTGWVSGRYVAVSNAHLVPVAGSTPTTPPPASTGYNLTTRANLNIRSGPGTSSSIIGRIPNGGSAVIIARTADSGWWYVTFGGVTGWVSGAYVTLPSGINMGVIPLR